MSDLSNIEINYKETVNTILTNLCKLFVRRGYMEMPLDTCSFEESVIKEIHSNKMTNFTINDKKISIHILNQEVKNISANSPIDDYLGKNLDTHKFLIVRYFAKKTYKQVTSDYVNCEIFSIHEFLEDIPSKLFIPEHAIVRGKDKEELLDTFAIKELGRIYSTEMMARYYGAVLNDVFRISRPNITSGHSIYYRVVVPGSLEIFS
jgi:DNA-directed RNA polymerase subunit H (RpoH/RPB5)